MNKKLGRGRIGKKIMAVLLCFIMLGQDVAFAAEAVRTGNEPSSQIVQVDSGEGELVDKSPNSEVEIGDVNSDSKTDRNEGSSSEDNSAGEDSSSGSGDNQETNSESSSLPDSSSSQPDTSSDSSVGSSDNSDSSSDAGNSDSTSNSSSNDNSNSSSGSNSDTEEEIKIVEDFNIVLPEGKEYFEIRIGDEAFPIELIFTPEGAKPEKIEYLVANEDIAKVTDGKLIGVSVPEDAEMGETELTVRVDGTEKSVKVVVLPKEQQEEKPPFESLVVMSPESDVIKAEVGQEVTLQAEVNREDVKILYQWQRLQKERADKEYGETIYDYAEGSPRSYSFVYSDTTESEYLSQYPDATFPGIEMYYAVKAALEEIGEDASDLSLAWRTPNFALDGYTVSAGYENGVLKVFADKEGMRYTAVKNGENKWEFSETPGEVAYTWQDIEGATESSYTFTVSEKDMDSLYRCKITVVDEEYLNACLKILEGEDVTPTDGQLESDQVLYTPSYSFEGEEFTEEEADEKSQVFMSMYSALGGRAAVGNPKLSADRQWIEGLNGRYEYITKDTYDRVSKWLKEGKISQVQADRYWTGLLPSGFSGMRQANVLDENGFPVGGENNLRLYNGFDLTDGMLEVNSEWYGKTVYFRVDVNGKENWGSTGTAIKVPAYTELSTDSDGNYIEGASGTKYKKAITMLNPYVIDTGSKYYDFTKRQDITTGKNDPKGQGWVLDANTGNATDNHVRVYAVNCENFNKDPQRYMVDAEGNYRVDSVAWGVCTGEEPDISGKAYWVLKDYIADGYGFMAGHDTMYSYAGAYYDAFGVDLEESTIDPNDGTTWYYDINSWMPGTTATSYNRDSSNTITGIAGKSETRGGHFYMNQLMGSNKGNVFSDTVKPSDAPSYILSLGGSHGPLGKFTMYGTEELKVLQTGYTHEQALANAKYRTPTNYPFVFSTNEIFAAADTHTNQQVAFGPIWVNYHGTNGQIKWGNQADSVGVEVDGQKGTNNFYLSGTGNFLMNQVGHLPENKLTIGEAKLFMNSLFYISQRKQCEICAANQSGQETVHFVHRVSSVNAQQVLEALQSGGTYWYPIDDCYILTEDISLPEGWQPIEKFNGHWDSDVYKVNLNSRETPLFKNDRADGKSGWNLGTDQNKGVEYVFDADMNRTTGIARVVGDLNDLFGTATSYAGYTVKILGSDNPKYMSAGDEYSCKVNPDSKYVISNLPCIFDDLTFSGVLNVRVYRPDGKEVTEYGTIRVNVNKDFWNNDMTTPLYLGSFSSEPVINQTTYESAHAGFTARALADEEIEIQGWKYRIDDKSPWQDIPADWDVSVSNEVKSNLDGNYIAETKFSINNAVPGWDDYEFKAVFSSENYGTWNTYEYWVNGVVANETSGASYRKVATPQARGKLDVLLWPAYAQQGNNVTTVDGGSATFSSTGIALDGGDSIKAVWQYSTKEFDTFKGEYLEWHDIEGSNEFGGLQEITTGTPTEDTRGCITEALSEVNTSLQDFHKNAKFHKLETSITLNKVDISQTETHFRVHYTATSSHGTVYDWCSNIADDMTFLWTTNDGSFAGDKPTKNERYSNILTVALPELKTVTTPSALCAGATNPDTITPDEYGQLLLIKNIGSTTAAGTAVYEAIVYYRGNGVPEPAWQYMTYLDHTPKHWATSGNTASDVAHSLGYKNANVTVTNTDLGLVSDGAYKGYKAIKSVMTIANVPLSMYNSENMTKYYFRCIGTMSYSTLKEEKSLSSVDQWGGLTLDYEIALQHNGVLSYGQKNIINGQTVTDAEGIVSATKNKTSSNWRYPNLTIKIPEGRHINTVIAYFDEESPRNKNDFITCNKTEIEKLGVKIEESTNSKLVLVSKNKDKVELDTWHKILREYVSFTTYDEAKYTAETIANQTTGGAKVNWIADELRLAGVTTDTSTGHVYKVVTKKDIISWDDAQREAQSYNADLGINGYLAEISSAEENAIIQKQLGDGDSWIGGTKTSGSWKWAKSNSDIKYTNWDTSANANNNYLAMQSSGKWTSYNASSPINKPVTVVNLATASNGGWSVMFNPHSIPFSIIKGHKYYVATTAGDYGDANGQCAVQCSELGIYEKNNANNSYNNWKTQINGIYTANSTGTANLVYNDFGYGSNVTGNYVVRYGANIYDLTAAFGAGNEPDGTWCYRNLSGFNEWGDCSFKGNVTVDYHIQNITDVKKYVVEYDVDSLSFATTNHSASDTDYIGTDVAMDIETEKKVTAYIVGNSKVYDGQPIAPESFAVNGSTGANADLFQIVYTAPQANNHAAYSPKVVGGADWRNTEAVNATRYHVRVELTDEAKAAGWELDKRNSQLECDLIITQRPITVCSYNNDKVYDGNSNGTIENIRVKDAASIIPGDVVNLNTTSVKGYYTENGKVQTSHNSKTNNNGAEWIMQRDEKTSSLYIVHDDYSDPHYNYKLGNEDYTGAITPRGLYVHSLYLEDPDNVRNVKAYDGTNAATIRDILIDGIVDGDNIGIEKSTMYGTYQSKDAGETLNADGSVQTDRFKKLQEYTIIPNTNAVLTGNDYGDYFIEREEYSGAIYRQSMIVMVKGWRGLYGEGMKEMPRANSSYSALNPGNLMSWLIIDGLVGTDTIDLDEQQRNQFATEYITLSEMQESSPVKPSVGNYPITYEEIKESNFPVLKNYLVSVMDNTIKIEPREIVIEVNDSDKMTEDENPIFHSQFNYRKVDGELQFVGDDAIDGYGDMTLVNGDSVLSSVLVRMQGAADADNLSKTADGASNIPYKTDCTKDSPPTYLETADMTLHECAWCENYFGFKRGTEHWSLTGYPVDINRSNEVGNSIEVAKVINAAGEEVENYTISVVPGMLRVHPKLRFQLKATVPMYVCMYGYRGDGEVVEPENYGITNYSNGAIKVTDVTVSEDGWRIVDKAPKELLKGEMSMNMNGLQLVSGSNDMSEQLHKWIVGKDASADKSGQFKLLPLKCYIAGGNVNAADHSFVTKVKYTIEEYGITLPEGENELPPQISGQPVNP